MSELLKTQDIVRSQSEAIKVYLNKDAASVYVAERIANIIKNKQNKGEYAVLGLATGSTPKGVYRELVRLHKEEGLSFKNVVTFNLDEYYPILPVDNMSYRVFMNRNLFDYVDIDLNHVHIPDGTLPLEGIKEFCDLYEAKIKEYGGIDLQLLGIGRTGHIGFNEPGAVVESKTRLVTLNKITREDAIDDFGGLQNVPVQAITMGVDTISSAREVVLMALTNRKAEIIKKAIEGEVSAMIPATYLQNLAHVEYILDSEAAVLLSKDKYNLIEK